MATKTRCQSCGVRLRVWLPPGAQSFQCPVCQQISPLQPAYFQPPARLPSQLPERPPSPPARQPSQPSWQMSQPPVRQPSQSAWHQSQPPARMPSQPVKQPSRRPSLVRAPSMQGRKRAVLCGLNYIGQEHSLDGCANDVKDMKYFLQYQMGFPDDSILTLTEYEKNPSRIPTKRNMLMALQWLVEGCTVGTSLVFYYSGHATRKVDGDYNEIDGYDEALCPIDYKDAGMLLDDEINSIIVNKLPKGVRLHAIIDTCFSGTVLDLPFVCTSDSEGRNPQYEWEDHAFTVQDYDCTQGGLAVCISACPDHKSSMSTTAFTGNSTGALTHCFIEAVKRAPGLTYGNLLYSVRSLIQEARAKASGESTSDIGDPVLSSSEVFDIHSRKFIL